MRIETFASAAVPGALLIDTSDGCGPSCRSACSTSTASAADLSPGDGPSSRPVRYWAR
ncbi:FxLD family lanthipeptide [Streptomyces sp. NPDC086081]|uniref:FxLD family lanthipeptide n=1 Tax=Streptomyces sp. NPDC086081 TaxID=3365749 RepID=UPI0037F230BC